MITGIENSWNRDKNAGYFVILTKTVFFSRQINTYWMMTGNFLKISLCMYIKLMYVNWISN